MEKFALFVLRLGLAITFIYAGVAGFMTPNDWIGFVPTFVDKIMPATTFLVVWGVIEIIIGVWLIFGKKIFIPSLIATLSLAGLIAMNLDAMEVIFRDIGLLGAALALTIWNYRQ